LYITALIFKQNNLRMMKTPPNSNFFIKPLFFLLCISMHAHVFAQPVTSPAKLRPVATAVVNFQQLSNLEKIMPKSMFVKQAPVPNEGAEYEEEPSAIVPPEFPAIVNANRGAAALSPTPVLNYEGAPDEALGGGTSGSFIVPPDTYGATGLDKVFVTLNNNYKVLNKSTGAQLSLVSMPSFWASLGTAASGPFDPRIVYDPYNNRWIHAAVSNGGNAASRLLLAISRSHDPAGTYDLFAFDPDAGTTLWADFPILGFNKNWIAISLNMFTVAGGTSSGSKLFTIDYPILLTGTATATELTGATSAGFCLNPVETYSSTENTLYIPVHTSSGSAAYRLNTITGTPAAPVFTLGISQTRTGGGWVQPGGSIGPQQCVTAPCPGVLTLLDVGDAFLRSNAVFRNGNIWYTQSVGLPTPTLTHVATQWTKISTTGAYVDGGRIEDATATATNGGQWYTYSSVSVNKNDDMLAGFSKIESDGYAGAAYAMRLGTDAAGTTQDPVVYKDGEDYYDKAASGRTRWGDYSHVSVDPLDDVSFWTWQEYARPRATPTVFGTTAKFGTWVAKVAPNPCLSGVASGNWNTAATWGCGSVPTANNNVSIMAGQNVTLDVNPSAATITVNEGATLTVNAARTLSCKLIVYGTLNITGGSLTLGNNDIFLSRNATLTGSSITRFFVTNGTGLVTKMIGAGASFEFPLSANGTTYNGLVVSLNAGDPEEVFSVRVSTGLNPASTGSALCVQRTWQINEMKKGGNNANLTFKWVAADNGASFNTGSSVFAYRHNGTSYVPGANLTIPSLAGGIYSASTTAAVSSFSPWIVTSSSVLPINFEYFTGRRQNENHQLSWKLNCENGSDHFEIERSTDGNNFKNIGTVAINNGCLTAFNFSDISPIAGKNYYRLKLINVNGRASFSNIILLLNQKDGFELVGLFPNVVKTTAVLNVSSANKGRIDVNVLDGQGRLIQQLTSDLISGLNQIDMNFSSLAAGGYFVKVVSENGDEQNIRFIKE
jgi:G8 domain